MNHRQIILSIMAIIAGIGLTACVIFTKAHNIVLDCALSAYIAYWIGFYSDSNQRQQLKSFFINIVNKISNSV